MGKPRIHIFNRDALTNVPLFVDSPIVRDRFLVTRGSSIPTPTPDLVIFETDHVVAAKTMAPYVMMVNGFWPKEETRPGKLKRIGVAMRNAKAVVCASKFLEKQVVSHFKANKTRVLPGGLWGTDHVKYKVNPERFRPKKHYRQHRRGPLVVMSISLASEIKWRGIDLLMQAAGGVFEKHNANVVCRAMVRGRGDLVKRWAKEYGLTFNSWNRGDSLGFTKGNGDAVWPRLLRRSDLFIHPSTWDAWGCVVADAMFTAVPSLVFKGTGSAEISDAAYKVRPDNSVEIADAVDRLLSMGPRDREDYGNKLRVEAIRKNEAHRGDIADVLASVLEGMK